VAEVLEATVLFLLPSRAFREPPKLLNIIMGTGMSYSRPDGINVIS